MYRCTGWCVLAVTPSGWTSEADAQGAKSLQDACRLLHSKWAHQLGNFAIRWQNAEPLLTFACAGNHGAYSQRALRDLALHIGRVAPRSYGIFQISDDEVTEDGLCLVRLIRLVGQDVSVEDDSRLTAFARETDDLGREPD